MSSSIIGQLTVEVIPTRELEARGWTNIMRMIKRVRREAKHLFRLCIVDACLDEHRVRQVVKSILATKRRGYLALANQFERLVRLERLRHGVKVERASHLPLHLQADIRGSLTRMYGSTTHASRSQRVQH